MREIKYTNRFKRDHKREKSGRHGKILDVVLMEAVNMLTARHFRAVSPRSMIGFTFALDRTRNVMWRAFLSPSTMNVGSSVSTA